MGYAPVHNHVFASREPVCKVCGYNPEEELQDVRFRGVVLDRAQADKLVSVVDEPDASAVRLTNGPDGWVDVVLFDPEGEPIGNVIQLPPA